MPKRYPNVPQDEIEGGPHGHIHPIDVVVLPLVFIGSAAAAALWCSRRNSSRQGGTAKSRKDGSTAASPDVERAEALGVGAHGTVVQAAVHGARHAESAPPQFIVQQSGGSDAGVVMLSLEASGAEDREAPVMAAPPRPQCALTQEEDAGQLCATQQQRVVDMPVREIGGAPLFHPRNNRYSAASIRVPDSNGPSSSSTATAADAGNTGRGGAGGRRNEPMIIVLERSKAAGGAD